MAQCHRSNKANSIALPPFALSPTYPSHRIIYHYSTFRVLKPEHSGWTGRIKKVSIFLLIKTSERCRNSQCHGCFPTVTPISRVRLSPCLSKHIYIYIYTFCDKVPVYLGMCGQWSIETFAKKYLLFTICNDVSHWLGAGLESALRCTRRLLLIYTINIKCITSKWLHIRAC